jgi:hypothetical protein
MLSAIGFLLASVFACAASLLCLVGTQGLHGNEPFFSLFLPFWVILTLTNGIPAALGLVPVGVKRGPGAWRAAMLGFLAGALIQALLVATFLINLPALLIPPIGGGLALFLYQGDVEPPPGAD